LDFSGGERPEGGARSSRFSSDAYPWGGKKEGVVSLTGRRRLPWTPVPFSSPFPLGSEKKREKNTPAQSSEKKVGGEGGGDGFLLHLPFRQGEEKKKIRTGSGRGGERIGPAVPRTFISLTDERGGGGGGGGVEKKEKKKTPDYNP